MEEQNDNLASEAMEMISNLNDRINQLLDLVADLRERVSDLE